MKDRGYISIARTVIISAISGLIAFGGAVLYLGGDDSDHFHPEHFGYSESAINTAIDFAICADDAVANWIFDIDRDIHWDRAFEIYDAAREACLDDAWDQWVVDIMQIDE